MNHLSTLKAEELLLGEGWSTQEFYNDHSRRAYRWTSGGASELYVDTTVVNRIKIRGTLSGYVTENRSVTFVVDGQERPVQANVSANEQQFVVDMPNNPSQPVVKVVMKTGFFVPHRVVQNNDYRSLGMQVFSFALGYKDNTTREVSIHLINNHLQYYDILKEERNKIVGAKEIRRDSYGALHLSFDPAKRTGKMNMNGVLTFVGHRYGWSYVLGLLQQFHGSDGPMLDGFIDSTFRWNHLAVPPVNERELPYHTPWFGFMHNPVLKMPEWFTSHEMQPGSFLRAPMFRASLPSCKGIYVLAKPAAEFLGDFLPVPVNHVYHPTGIPLPEHMFSMEKLDGNPKASLVQVGWWCRRFKSLYDVTSPYRKVFLNPHVNNRSSVDALRRIEANVQKYELSATQEASVTHQDFLTDQMYDVLLSNNIVMLHLYDAIANNAIIECMARATPVLVNPLPCVVDYLGEDYPFYFKDIDEASKKLGSRTLIKETHEYLLKSGVADKVKPETFLRDLQETSIFKSL
jgi:hypothetical protein